MRRAYSFNAPRGVSGDRGVVTGCKGPAPRAALLTSRYIPGRDAARRLPDSFRMPSPQRQKILVVDDDLRLRDLLKRYLTEQGFAVDTVPDAGAMDRQQQRVRYA